MKNLEKIFESILKESRVLCARCCNEIDVGYEDEEWVDGKCYCGRCIKKLKNLNGEDQDWFHDLIDRRPK